MRSLRTFGIVVTAAAAFLAAPGGAAEDGGAAGQSAAPSPEAIKQYCTNIRDAAADARMAWQAKQLLELQTQIESRIAELNARQAEYEEWLKRRDEFLAKAGQQVSEIYAKMRPDAAAQQLAAIDDETAASVLANLVPRSASAILNEMEPRRAAQLALAIAGPPEPDGEATQ